MRNVLLIIYLIFGVTVYGQIPDTCFTSDEIQDISYTLDSLYYIDSVNTEIINKQSYLIKQQEQVISISELQLQYKTTQIKLLEDNINLYIKREKISKKWYSHPALWFSGGVITTVGLTIAILGILN